MELNNVPKHGISKLNGDCFDHIFDYLKMRDVQSFGQASKILLPVAGDYYKRNYKSKYNNFDYRHFQRSLSMDLQSLPSFYPFMNSLYLYYNIYGAIEHIASHGNKFISLKRFSLSDISAFLLNDFRNIWPIIEVLEIQSDVNSGKELENLFKKCVKLKNLKLYGLSTYATRNEWLLQKMPKLESFRIDVVEEIDNLIRFLEINPNIRTFAITGEVLYQYWQQLMHCEAKLELLKLYCDENFKPNWMSFADCLNQLHGNGFYKKLRLRIKQVTNENYDAIHSIQGLHSLTVDLIKKSVPKSFDFKLTNLRELIICKRIPDDAPSFGNICDHLENLTVLRVSEIFYGDLLKIVSQTVKLRQIQCSVFKTSTEETDDGVVNLVELNKERAKLLLASKLMLYVPEFNFLATKWATPDGDMDLSMVEIRKDTSE